MLEILIWNSLLAGTMAVTVKLVSRLSYLQRRPSLVYGLWCVVLLKLVTPPLIPIPVLAADPTLDFLPVESEVEPAVLAMERPSEASLPSQEPASDPVESLTQTAANNEQEVVVPTTTREDLSDTPPAGSGLFSRVPVTAWLLLAWGCGAGVLLIRLMRQHLAARRLLKTGKFDPSLTACVRSLAGDQRKRVPNVVIVDAAISPALAGWIGPKILLPRVCLSSLTPQELDRVMAHELAHYARGDHMVSLVVTLIHVLFWWNPLVWWTVRELKSAQELSCDALVVARPDVSCADYAGTVWKVFNLLETSSLVPIPGVAMAMPWSAGLLQRRFVMLGADPVGPGLGRPALCSLVLLSVAFHCFPVADESAAQISNTAVENSESTSKDGDAVTHGFEIAGKVIVGKNRTPLPGIEIQLVKLEGLTNQPGQVATTTSDAEGNYRFAPVAPPRDMRPDRLRYFLVADRPDHTVTAQWVYRIQKGRPTDLWLPERAASLKGRVVDEDGQPVAGARIIPGYAPDGEVPGVSVAVTNENGLFKLARLPRIVADETFMRVLSVRVQHADFPTKFFKVEQIPDSVRFTLPGGCTLTGEARADDPGVSVASVVVTAENVESAAKTHTVTDTEGRYRLVVPQGNYNIVLDDANITAPAIADIECRAGTERRVSPLLAGAGGWIEGQVLNTRTGLPMSMTDDGDPILVGLYGPSHVRGRVISPTGMAKTDKNGRFRVRAAPGENFPYFVNINGERMAWDTTKQSPVVVSAGQTTAFDMLITPPLTDEEKLAKAQQVVDSLPMEKDARIASIIGEFRELNQTIDETEIWSMLVQELKKIGSDAVPALCAELDATNERRMIIRLCFSLRAIGDPSAVPALIRCLPKTLLVSGDYGLIVADSDLAAFMRKYSATGTMSGKYFDVTKVVREVHSTITQLTDRRVDAQRLYSMIRSDDLRNLARQQEYYHQAATDWATWWEAHWNEFDVDSSLSAVHLPAWTPPDLSNYPTGLNITANATVGGGLIGPVLTPIGDADHGARFFRDLDTGHAMSWPEDLPADDDSPETVAAARKWGAARGMDLMCVMREDENGHPTYTLEGINLRLWEIDPLDAKNIEKRVAAGKLPAGRKLTTDALLHEDPNSGTNRSEIGSSFLYVTAQESLGMITITDFVTIARDITGQAMRQKGVGFHRGVRFNIRQIAR